jgi:5-methylcytosine-specific restriction protein B
MNTADRSVEALDAALRRRFTFEEMAPKPELVSPSMMLQRLWIRDMDLAWTDPNWIKAENEFLDLFNAKILNRKDYENLENTVNLESLNISFDKIVKFEGINFETILSNINQRIELLLDKDHQIGHSYLINVYSLDQLKSAFQNKIIPLLQEYFFGDYGKIGLILGEKFFENGKESKEMKFKNFFDYSEDGFSEKKVYRLKNLEIMDNDAFKLAIEDLMN